MSKRAGKILLAVLAVLLLIWLIVSYIRMAMPAEMGNKLNCRDIRNSVITIVRTEQNGQQELCIRLTEASDRKWLLDGLSGIKVRMVPNQSTAYECKWSLAKVDRTGVLFTIVVTDDRVLFDGLYHETTPPDAVDKLLSEAWERYSDLIKPIGEEDGNTAVSD